ncbi:MAG: hypothetical protein HYT80_06220 [Euryarchaeota archaeon]|nr:hypothetical protein [Euryarchaeota archaeon]
MIIVLRRKRDLEHVEVKGMVDESTTGSYVAEPDGFYWNPHWIPPGFVAWYHEGNPEPIRPVEPKGYNARFLQMATGNLPGHYIGLANQGRGLTLSWKVAVAVLVGVVGLVVAAALWAQRNGIRVI